MKPSLSLQFKRGCSSHTVSPAVFGSARSISLKVLLHHGTCLPKGLSFLPVFFFFGGSFHHGISTAQIRWAKRRGVAGARGRSSWHNRENLLLLLAEQCRRLLGGRSFGGGPGVEQGHWLQFYFFLSRRHPEEGTFVLSIQRHFTAQLRLRGRRSF